MSEATQYGKNPVPSAQPDKPKEPEKKKKNKRKKRRKWPWVLLAIVLLIVGVFLYLNSKADEIVSETIFSTVSTTPLGKSDVQNSVNVSGTVSSNQNEKVFAPLNGYNIDDVFVEVGDNVMVDDLICQLDVSPLEVQIEQQEAAVKATQRSVGASVSSAQSSYDTAQEQLEQERNTAIVSAQTALTNAESAYQKAVDAYDDAELMYDLGELSESDLKSANTALQDAQTAVEDAILILENSRKSAEDTLKSARDSVKTAQAAGDTESQKIAIEDMRKQLEKGDIHAPMSGTITYVNADKGAVASGLMFLIEDLNDLVVETKVREYDAPNVKVGQRVIIKSDATGDLEFSGVVDYVAPTALKNPTNPQASTSGTVEFETKVMVDKTQSADTALKVGSTAQVYIIVEEVHDSWAVSYNAVLESDDGRELILVKETDENGLVTIREIPVTVGVQSDFLVQIQSQELREGMEVVDSPQDYYTLLEQMNPTTTISPNLDSEK